MDMPYRGGSRPAAGGDQTGFSSGTLARVAAGPAGQSGTAADGGNFVGFGGASRPAGGANAAGSQGGNSFQGFGSFVDQGGAAFVRGSSGQGLAPVFCSNRLCPSSRRLLLLTRLPPSPTLVFQSYGVTLTQFAVQTVTRPIQQVVVTPVDEVVAVSTTQVFRPE
ncbi:hypothetical protein GWK47_032741 [Chionoecetes opilio]|uniref:Uncharacterized protein n=1 Tax=Chionoecetes opilio TaxID=41210 RepID=A0A8J5D4A2_CHIOP|nr:hypothetical protein GWK47_032741 [Chionoecetes opilio]